MSEDESKNHGNSVFVFTETITPIKGRADDILALSLKSAGLLKGQPGLIQYMVSKSDKAASEIFTTTVWAHKSDFQNFMKSETAAELLKSEDMAYVKAWMGDYKATMSNYVDGWHP